jgi:putative membrane protein
VTVPEAAGSASTDASAEPARALAGGKHPPAAAGFADPDAHWRRLSPRSMVVRPLTDLVRLLPLLAGLLLLHSHTGGGLIWGVGAAVLAIVTGLTHWATTRYLITDERLYLRHGLLNQKRLSVARDRIRTVDVTAHLLHRMLGVCRVSVGTGRNDFRSSENFHLDGLTRAEAESLRVELLSGTAAAWPVVPPAELARGTQTVPPSDQEPGTAPVAPAASAAAASPAPANAASVKAAPAARQAADQGREIVRLRLSWLRFAPLTMAGLVVLGVLFGAVVQLSNATDFNLVRRRPVRLLISDYASLSLGHRVLVGAAVAVVCYVLVAVVGYIAVFWNFRLTDAGAQTLRVTRGLLSVRATTISVARLSGVEISEPLLLRAARGARCIAITTGLRVGRGAEHEGSVLLPPAPVATARAVAVTVLGIAEELCSGPLVRHGKAAAIRRLTRALTGAVAIVVAIAIATIVRHGPSWIWLSSLALLPAACAIAADRYLSLGHRLTGGWLVTRTGSLARRRSIIGTDAIIGWRIHQTWFQRRQGLVTLTATTAAGQQHYSVHDVPAGQALEIAASATSSLVRPILAPHARAGDQADQTS